MARKTEYKSCYDSYSSEKRDWYEESIKRWQVIQDCSERMRIKPRTTTLGLYFSHSK